MGSTTAEAHDVVDEAAVESKSLEHGISHKVKDVYRTMCKGYHTVADKTDVATKWVYRKAFSLDLPVETNDRHGYDADRGGFGFMLGYTWSCMSTFLFVYEMVSVGLLAESLLGSSSSSSNEKLHTVLGTLTVAFMVLPTVVMALIALGIADGRALARWAQKTSSSCFGRVKNDCFSCVSTVYGDSSIGIRSLGTSFRKGYLTVVKDLASYFRRITSSPGNFFAGIIISPLLILLWSFLFVFFGLVFALFIVCFTVIVVGGAVAFTLLQSAVFVVIVVIVLAFLLFITGIVAIFSVVADIVAIFCWIFSPWVAAVLNVLGGRYRSCRGVVNAGFHTVPQAVLQIVLLTTTSGSRNSGVPRLQIIKTLVIVVLSGSWATVTVCVQARHFCRKQCGLPSTSLVFYVKEGIIVPLFGKASLSMDDLNGLNIRETGTETQETERTNSDHSAV